MKHFFRSWRPDRMFGFSLKILLCAILGIGLIQLRPLQAEQKGPAFFKQRMVRPQIPLPQRGKRFYTDAWNLGIPVLRYQRKIARAAAQSNIPNPRELAVDIRTPFNTPAETSANATWCAPDHWTPWNGDWAFDIWRDNGSAGVENPNTTCDQDVFLRVSPSTLPDGTVPNRIRAQTINVSSHVFACASRNFDDGGYQQAFMIYATYAGEEIAIGWVLYAHLDDVVFANENGEPQAGIWIEDPMNVRIGSVFNGDYTSNCWGGCHIHMEFYNSDLGTLSCYQNVCQALPENNIPVIGVGSIVGKLGGNLNELQNCPVYENEEQLPCATWDMDLEGCNRHGGNPFWKPAWGDPNVYDDTQDCAYYTTSDKCRPRGTSNCMAGINSDCEEFNDETFPCSTWDGDLNACNQHGGNPFWKPPGGDPNVDDDTQDCAYYTTSDRCAARGTSNCAAGILCDGAP
jgi:hypothetical protein